MNDAATKLAEPEAEDIASALIETAQILGATTALIRRDRDVESKLGRPGIGSLIIVDDVEPSTGPDRFGGEAVTVLDRAHGIFITVDAGEEVLSKLLTTAMGANVGVILTDIRRVPEWEQYVGQIAPGTLRMTCVGDALSPTVDASGTA
jgi:hypothetical protein